MRLKHFPILFLTILNIEVARSQLHSYVNPFIGATTSTDAAGIYHGLGKTFPGATTPYGLVQVSPNTITGGDNGSGYSYEHKTIEGFAFTQMSGVGWYGDLGNILVMPTNGDLQTWSGRENIAGKGYRSHYDKGSEKAGAGYYAVMLTDYNIKTEVTAAPHSGMLRFVFPENKRSRIQVDLARRVGGTSVLQHVKVINDNTICGWAKCTAEGGGWGNGDGKANYTVYFYMTFSKPFGRYGVWSATIPDGWLRKREDIEKPEYINAIKNAKIIESVKEFEGKHIGFYLEFPTSANEQVLVKSGISFVSVENAKENLETEIKDWNFEAVKNKAEKLWDRALSKISIQGGTPDQKVIFYTALYHTMLDPRIFQDVNGEYIGGDQKVHKAPNFTKRTIFSGWDVFRSQIPLQTIINPSLVNDLVNSLVTLADESGKHYLERWELLNAYSGCMIGNPGVSVLAEAYAKGIRNFDVEKAYQYARNSVEKFGNGSKGFSPGGLCISNTLEYAYADWCIYRLAHYLGKEEDSKIYLKRSFAYKNIFDSQKGWFRPKNEEGKWADWPSEGRLKQWYGTIECNPYQQGWFVPHDVGGMVNLMGGRAKAVRDLENLFRKTPRDFRWNDYYNHANEPVHHVPFLFNRLGAPWLTQKWTRTIVDNAYHNSVEGIVGNEDVGQMSAWYVLAASGLHPVCPADTRYEITSPSFKSVVLNLDKVYSQGSSFTIKAINNSRKNIYIQKATLNGKPYNRCFIDYSEIKKGGELVLYMGVKPNKEWGKNL